MEWSLPQAPQVVVETPVFLSRSKKLLSQADREGLVWFVANDPEAGVLIQGTGGVRKLRYAIGGRGKSGGVRVIYFFHDREMPIYLLTVFAKNQKSSLTTGEKNRLQQLTTELVRTYKERHHEQ